MWTEMTVREMSIVVIFISDIVDIVPMSVSKSKFYFLTMNR